MIFFEYYVLHWTSFLNGYNATDSIHSLISVGISFNGLFDIYVICYWVFISHLHEIQFIWKRLEPKLTVQ